MRDRIFPRSGYNASASSTAGPQGDYAEIVYLGAVTGGWGTSDENFSVVVTPTSSPSPSWNQSFLAVNASSWAQTAADGFFGLAFSTISDAGANTVVETMLWDGLLDAPRFAMYYGTEFSNTGANADGSGPGDGVLTIGGSREETYVEGAEAGTTWVPLVLLDGQTEYQVWRGKLLSISASRTGDGNGTTTTTIDTATAADAQAATESSVDFYNTYAVFDSGAGSMSVPESQVDAIYEAIGLWSYRDILERGRVPLCAEFNSSWSVSFHFQGDDAADASDVRTVTLTGDQLARPGFANGRQDTCWPPFEGGNGDGFFLLGTPLLNKFYTIWDFGADKVEAYKPQVGFGKLKSGL
ncbi:hypothetical protein SLS62_006985 [Diatrype stigma]|uniref:Peptidase A1 domain-containing protein n=1 Tax=Diatrype stigma TaxID=117547 RepID=A0AAN9URJ9_9PEZI